MKYITCEKIDATGLAKTVCTLKGSGVWTMEQKNPKSFAELGSELGITADKMVRVLQKHTDVVKIVKAEDAGNGVVRPSAFGECDGIVTNERGILLCTLEADCVPVFILDPVHKAVGMIHSGWRGTAAKITQNAIKIMQSEYGTSPKDLIICTAPHICAECYEVSGDLIEGFSRNFTADEISQFFTVKENGKYLLNLTEAIRITSLSCGVKAENFHDMENCTYHTDLFPSYRKENGTDDRMLTGIMLV